MWRYPLALAGMLEAQAARLQGAEGIERKRDWGAALKVLKEATASGSDL